MLNVYIYVIWKLVIPNAVHMTYHPAETTVEYLANVNIKDIKHVDVLKLFS